MRERRVRESRWRRARKALPVVALAAALVALVGWVSAHGGRPTMWDQSLHQWAVTHRPASLAGFARGLTRTGQQPALLVAAAAGLLVVPLRRWWWRALVGVGLLVLGQLVRVGLSVAVGRARPPAADWAAPAGGYALPSGHTTTATLAAGLLCLGLWRTMRGILRRLGIAVAVLWAAGVGATRVYLGVHWPSDVLAGWLLGSLLTLLAAAVLQRWRVPSEAQRAPASIGTSQQMGTRPGAAVTAGASCPGSARPAPPRARPEPDADEKAPDDVHDGT